MEPLAPFVTTLAMIDAVGSCNNAQDNRLTTRLDQIEHLLLAEQKHEIEDLKKRMKRFEEHPACRPAGVAV